MDFFEVIGSFGPWQMRMFIYFTCMNVVGMWQNFAILFFAPNMDFSCVEPSPPNGSEAGVPTFDDRCWVPQVGQNLSYLVPCTQWKFDTSHTSQTIVSEWDLVCEREWLVSLTKSIYMIGYLFSVLVFGQISDSIGRYPTIVICYVINCISMILSLFSGSFTMFIILRFFHAFGRAGATTVGYVLLMEMIGPEYQADIGVATQLGWSAGYVTLVAIAWFFRHWFWLQLVITLFFLPFLAFFRYIPESPRWLLIQGKTEKLEKLLIEAAKINRREVKEDLLRIKYVSEGKAKKTTTMLEVMRMPKLRKRTFVMLYLWFVNAFLYYGLSYNTNDLAGDAYLNCFLSGLIEFPARLLTLWGIKKWGRRPTFILCMAVGGVACAAMMFVPQDTSWLSTTFAMVGKFCVTGTFAVLYVYTTEIFPTSVRNATLGSCSMCARVGSILAPFVRELGKMTHAAVPNVLYTLLALTSSLMTLMLPETRGLDLPDTLQQAEDIDQSKEKYRKTSASNESIPLTDY
ncbi:organic cation transporter protein [Caerostris darwini]|uniref:Organic cation transporter protein n=1 Tax=Caerostris darwini TaxID=1538125 RepID=A0AAV4NJ69_9ARAC|nr:organic cation transporter protein [Caerostris darwini]